MMMSTKGRYGLRLAVALASRYGQGPVGVETLATEEEITANYIHVLLGSLKSSGLVRSLRGRDGGYVLAQKPENVTAYDVITALQGHDKCVDCVNDPTLCQRSAFCPTRGVWRQTAQAIDKVLQGVTLKSLASAPKARPSEPDYSI